MNTHMELLEVHMDGIAHIQAGGIHTMEETLDGTIQTIMAA